MVETLTFRPIYIEDLALGTGTENVTLADGSVVALTKVNLTTLASGVASASSYLDLSQQSTAPGTPGSSATRLYQKTDGYWYTKNDAGTEAEFPATVGTLTRGVWNGTAISVLYGGTGLTALAAGSIIYASATNTGAQLTIGASGYVIKSNGTVPAWGQTPFTAICLQVAFPHPDATASYTSISTGEGSTSESLVSGLWPKTGTFSTLYLLMTSAHTANITATLIVNGTETALTATVLANQTTASDLTHSVAITAGQTVSVKNISATGTASGWLKFAFVFTE